MDKPAWWRDSWPLGRSGQSMSGMSDARKLEIVQGELAWAQKCFYYAQSVLPDSLAKDKAGRMAEIIGRARQVIATTEAAQAAAMAVDELSPIGRYDPERYPKAFVEAAGRSISAAGRAMEASTLATVAYWGRVFVRAGGFFCSMGQELPER